MNIATCDLGSQCLGILQVSKYTRRKSSTGCWTCRSRHIKCDEERPSCQRCTRSDIPYEGYSMRLTWVAGSNSLLEDAISTTAPGNGIPPNQETFQDSKFPEETGDCVPITQSVRHIAYERLPKRHRGHMDEISGCSSTWPLDHYIEIVNDLLPCPISLSMNGSSETGSSPEPAIHDRSKFHIARMKPEQIEFLDSQSALSVTTGELRDRLLQAYVRWVHPQLPVIDAPEVCKAILVDREIDFPNPLLYQAIMFAGSAFVDFQYIEAAGYRSRLELRQSLFLRAKLLYEFEAEAHSLPLAQASLLMSYWDDTSDNLEDPSHWLAVAWKVALNASLFEASAEKPNQARKLWWCFHIRNKIISLNLRKSPHIKCLNFDVERLTIDDFHTEVYDIKVLLALSDSVPSLVSDSQKMMFITFLQMTQLCICVHHVLEDLYEDTWNSTGEYQYDLGPYQSLGSPNIQHCIRLMRYWIDSLPATARDNPPFPLICDPTSVETVCLIQKAHLQILYLTTSCALLHSISCMNPEGQPRQPLRYTARFTLPERSFASNLSVYILKRG